MIRIQETDQQKEDRIICDLLARDFPKVYNQILDYIEQNEINY